jgi:hypothetical protein
MFINKVKETSNLHLEGDFEGLFHTIATITNKYKDIVSSEHIRF